MAPAEGPAVVGIVGSQLGASLESVHELLQEHFPYLCSSADQLLFEPDSPHFGLFQYATVVNNICKAIADDGEGTTSHKSSVIWVTAAFLCLQKLIHTGASLDAHLSMSCPTRVDYAPLHKYCSKKTVSNGHTVTDQQLPTSPVCSASLCVADVERVCVANMKLLMPCKLYTAYTNVICAQGKEALAASFAEVVMQTMLGICFVASSCYVKVAASLSEVDPNIPSPGLLWPKEDVSDDLLQTLTGSYYGHHPLLTVNAALGGHVLSATGEIDWPGTLKQYEEGLVWLNDWNVTGRDDVLASKVADMVCPDTTPHVDNTPGPTDDTIIARERNRLGCMVNRWDTQTENALTMGRVKKFARHTGWLCQQPDMVRQIVISTTSYFGYGVWTFGVCKDVSSLWYGLLSIVSAMFNASMIDHDTEADIGEHNCINWVCKACIEATHARFRASKRDPPKRPVVAQRLAYGPQLYCFYTRRHSGFARRVYSSKFTSRVGIQWGTVQCTAFHEPVAAPVKFKSVEALILHLLRLAGFTVDDTGLALLCAAMPEVVDPAKAGMCENCAVEGIGLEMMMYGLGAMVVAAMLPEPARRRFCWEIDGYGGRAFPTLQSRILSTCACSPYWMEEVLQLGYAWSLSPCGGDSCDADGVNNGCGVVPGPIDETGREWSKNPRTRANLQSLMAACKQQFDSMPSIKGQLESGQLDEEWSVLPCAGRVRAILDRKVRGE